MAVRVRTDWPLFGTTLGLVFFGLVMVYSASSVKSIAQELKHIIKNNSEVCDNYKTAIDYGYNPEFNSRTIVGDDYANLENRFYGNNNVKGSGPVHGTHVAGIVIGNDRFNVAAQAAQG